MRPGGLGQTAQSCVISSGTPAEPVRSSSASLAVRPAAVTYGTFVQQFPKESLYTNSLRKACVPIP